MRKNYDTSEAVEDIFCGCSRRPLLARLGSLDGKPFLHIKSVRSGRAIVDVKITGGVVDIICRECLRPQRINMTTVMKDSRILPAE